jgi:hypothetical protein
VPAGQEVVGVLGLGLAVEDLTPGALDLVVDVQLPGFEVDGLPRQAQHLPAAQPQAEDERPGREEVVIAGTSVRNWPASATDQGLTRRRRGLGTFTSEATFLLISSSATA